MAVQPTPYVETALSHTSELFRRELQAGIPLGAGGVVPATPATSVNATAGIAGCSDLSVNAPASGMSVLVNSGQIYIPGTLGSGVGYGMGIFYAYPTVTLNGGSAPTIATNAAATKQNLTTQGTYYCYNDNSAGQVSLVISASNPTNPRIDVVGAQVEDAAYSGSNNDWKLTVITGTAAASPTIPAFPANFVPLALVWVPANATSIVAGDIIDLRVAYGRNPFRAEMNNNSGQALATGVNLVQFTSLLHDLTGSCSLTTGFTCPVAGLWRVSGSWASTTSLAGGAAAQILKGGAAIKYGTQYLGSTVGVAWTVSGEIVANKGDVLALGANVGSGTGTVFSSSQYDWLTVSLVSLI